MTIKYPTWKMRGSPTPHEKLVICPKCGKAFWTMHTSPPTIKYCSYCPCIGRKRMREATPEEYEQGRAALEEILLEEIL